MRKGKREASKKTDFEITCCGIIFYFGVFLMETDILIMFSFLVHAAFQYFLMMFFSDLNLVNDALLVWVWLALVALCFC